MSFRWRSQCAIPENELLTLKVYYKLKLLQCLERVPTRSGLYIYANGGGLGP